MLLSRNSGCKGTKFISNAEIFFYLFSFNRASLACFYVKAALFLQEKRIYSPLYKIRLYILSSLLGFYLFLHVDELSLAVVEFVLQESEFL